MVVRALLSCGNDSYMTPKSRQFGEQKQMKERDFPSGSPKTRMSQKYAGVDSVATQQQFTPNGMRVLLPLLQAYPSFCSYDVLLASLFPLSRAEGHGLLHTSWEPSIRPLRRAIGSMLPGLSACGITVYSLRGLGYQLSRLSFG